MPDKQGRHSILTLRNIPFIPVSMEKSHLNTQAGTEASVKKMNIFLKNEDIFSCSNDAYTARDTDIFSQKKKWVGGTPFANSYHYALVIVCTFSGWVKCFSATRLMTSKLFKRIYSPVKGYFPLSPVVKPPSSQDKS